MQEVGQHTAGEVLRRVPVVSDRGAGVPDRPAEVADQHHITGPVGKLTERAGGRAPPQRAGAAPAVHNQSTRTGRADAPPASAHTMSPRPAVVAARDATTVAASSPVRGRRAAPPGRAFLGPSAHGTRASRPNPMTWRTSAPTAGLPPVTLAPTASASAADSASRAR